MSFGASRSKFRVAPKQERTIDGVVFASKREMNRYADLKQREKYGLISGLKLQPEFRVWINERPFCCYTADFEYVDVKTGIRVIEDTKSSGTRKDVAYRLRKHAAELYHDIKITEIVR